MTYWLPLASAANVAQGAAALAVAVKSKDKKIKALALPSSLSAFMGITEPAIFGVNLRFSNRSSQDVSVEDAVHSMHQSYTLEQKEPE
ncbi:MAG: PTS transporter subunit EIIC [Mediterraneibacter gnavus]